jgi:hypothetical protein
METRLTFIRRTSEVGDPSPKGLFQCQCGKIIEVRIGLFNSGHTRSCGCLRREGAYKMGRARWRHGHCSGDRGKSATRKSWEAMISRCPKIDDKDFSRYGRFGITVCERWRRFDNFLADMGVRPEGKTIDRIDNAGNYEPDNCRWATYREQRKNRGVARLFNYEGQQLMAIEIMELTQTAIPRSTFEYRLDHGWSVERALVR